MSLVVNSLSALWRVIAMTSRSSKTTCTRCARGVWKPMGLFRTIRSLSNLRTSETFGSRTGLAWPSPKPQPMGMDAFIPSRPIDRRSPAPRILFKDVYNAAGFTIFKENFDFWFCAGNALNHEGNPLSLLRSIIAGTTLPLYPFCISIINGSFNRVDQTLRSKSV
ncbi:hypothetical protein V2G26_015701 [Clonostachys chloroleuca]